MTLSEEIRALDAATAALPPHTPDALRKTTAALRAQLVADAWAKGDLAYKYDTMQAAIVTRMDATIGAPGTPLVGKSTAPPRDDAEALARIKAIKNLSAFLLMPRGFGKSYMLTVKAFSVCLATPMQRVLYVCPFAKDAAKLVNDIANLFVLGDCPEPLRTKIRDGWHAGDSEYHFPNGSVLRFAGTNNEGVERLRGPGAHFIVLDEAGSMDLFNNVYTVTAPVAERWNGRIWMATTPAKTPAHESKAVYEEHAVKGVAIKYVLTDSTRLSWDEMAQQLLKWKEKPEDISKILAGKMLPTTTDALRESWCEWVVDSESAIVPEWRHVRSEVVVKERPRPAFFHGITAADMGFVDGTGVLLAFWDWEEAVLVIEDEILARGANSQTTADAIEAAERRVWSDTKFSGGFTQPKRRVADVNETTRADLRTTHHLAFRIPEKPSFEANLNNMRQMVGAKQVLIHARCVHLLRQLADGVLNKQRTDFARDSMGHFDLIAALAYLCRDVQTLRHINPFPPDWKVPAWRPGRERVEEAVSQPEGFALSEDTEFTRRTREEAQRDVDVPQIFDNLW